MDDSKSNCLSSLKPVLEEIKRNKREKLAWTTDHNEWKPKNQKFNEWLNAQSIQSASPGDNWATNALNVTYNALKKESRFSTCANNVTSRHRDIYKCSDDIGEGWKWARGGHDGFPETRNCGTGRYMLCIRTDDKLIKDVESYKGSIKPPQPGTEPQFPTSVVTSNSVCCEQIFKDIKLTGDGDIDIKAVQNCYSKLNSDVAITPGAPGETDTTDDNTIFYLLGGGGSGIISSFFCCLLIIIIIIIML
jgi:hypothetical protein